MATSIAVIIGIDDYRSQPLTSACNDAVAVRNALIELNLVDARDVVLLTSPVRPDSHLADRRSLLDALQEVYDGGAALDRFYFYFAGHGLTGWTGASKTTVNTALVPREVMDLNHDANLLINIDDFRARMERAGPAEQYYFVDACRNLVFDERAFDLPGLGWPASRAPRTDPSAQSALFAVSPGGKALAEPEGLGVMSRHLVDALHGRGLALDWSEAADSWVVTSESIANHVREKVNDTLAGTPLWKQRYMIPDLRPTGPQLTPLRIVDPPPRPNFTLKFVPPEAAAWTSVRLKLRGQPLDTPCWPPRQPGEAIPLDPHIYRIDVEVPPPRTATADPLKVDLRLVDTASIHTTVAGADLPLLRPRPGPGTAQVDLLPDRPLRAERSVVRAQADEPSAVIELTQLDHPYQRWVAEVSFDPSTQTSSPDVWETRGPTLDEEVPPGSYRIRFRLGTAVYSTSEFDIVAGQTVEIVPRAELTATIAEAVPLGADGSVLLSETMGPLRSSPLLTALPVVGVIPFDANRELFSSFRNSLAPSIDTVDIAQLGGRALRIVLVADGYGWPIPPSEVAADVRCEIVDPTGFTTTFPLHPLAPGTDGWARLAHGTVAAPSGSFVLRVTSPVLGTIELASVGLPNRITVVGFVISPDGRLDVVQHVLRVPGRHYPQEPEPAISYGRTLRELVLGQQLYASDELITHGAVPDAQVLRDLLFAKWTDPVLGCMAYYAWNDAVKQGLPEAQGVAQSNTQITAFNLLRYFPEIPDVRIIAALARLPGVPDRPDLLAPEDVPLLARSLREAADRWPSWRSVRSWSSRVPPGNPWAVEWTSPDTTWAVRSDMED